MSDPRAGLELHEGPRSTACPGNDQLKAMEEPSYLPVLFNVGANVQVSMTAFQTHSGEPNIQRHS